MNRATSSRKNSLASLTSPENSLLETFAHRKSRGLAGKNSLPEALARREVSRENSLVETFARITR